MEEVKKVKITQIKSIIGQTKKQKRTIESLGLKRINHSVIHRSTPAIEGMIKRTRHLIFVQQI
jgi:large subunit ribosomal protein L30